MAYHRKPTEPTGFKTMTDQQKLEEFYAAADEDIIIKKKSLIACGLRFCFNTEGEIIKIQQVIYDKYGDVKRYDTLADSNVAVSA